MNIYDVCVRRRMRVGICMWHQHIRSVVDIGQASFVWVSVRVSVCVCGTVVMDLSVVSLCLSLSLARIVMCLWHARL
jgi:hypothetical protein